MTWNVSHSNVFGLMFQANTSWPSNATTIAMSDMEHITIRQPGKDDTMANGLRTFRALCLPNFDFKLIATRYNRSTCTYRIGHVCATRILAHYGSDVCVCSKGKVVYLLFLSSALASWLRAWLDSVVGSGGRWCFHLRVPALVWCFWLASGNPPPPFEFVLPSKSNTIQWGCPKLFWKRQSRCRMAPGSTTTRPTGSTPSVPSSRVYRMVGGLDTAPLQAWQYSNQFKMDYSVRTNTFWQLTREIVMDGGGLAAGRRLIP